MITSSHAVRLIVIRVSSLEMDPFRDDTTALQARTEELEAELVAAREELARVRSDQKEAHQEDDDATQEIAELERHLAELQRELAAEPSMRDTAAGRWLMVAALAVGTLVLMVAYGHR